MKRNAFTLVELLVVVAVIAILAGMMMVALAGAQTDARRMRAQGQLAKIDSLISQELEAFQFRRFDLSTTGGSSLGAREAGQARLMLIRDTMRLEFPDRITDIAVGPASIQVPPHTPLIRPAVNATQQRYRRRVVALMEASGEIGEGEGWSEALARWTQDELSMRNESAECLYLVLSGMFVGGKPALESFRRSEFDDTNGNGLPEIVDTWGNPVGWQRWPVGYWLTYEVRNVTDGDVAAEYMRTQAERLGPDEYDYLNSDPRASDPNSFIPFNCPPLFFSAGPDGEYGIIHSPLVSSGDFEEYGGRKHLAYGSMRSGGRPFPDPFLSEYLDEIPGGYFGAVGAHADRGSEDNVFSSFAGREES